MFEPVQSWSGPAALYKVSGWSATCTKRNDPSSCTNNIHLPVVFDPGAKDQTNVQLTTSSPIYAWTDITYLLHQHSVSWGYYVESGREPDCQNPSTLSCAPVRQSPSTLGFWNPLPYFDTVRNDNEVGNIQSVSNFYAAAKNGTLPAVSWIVPSWDTSEHPPGSVSAGQAYVTSLINAVMNSPEWNSTAIFLAWDDWGGHYDHVVPPTVDENGYGLRVPGIVISSYAKRGAIDHQNLSFDAYLRFIEDDFLGGQRLDPATDGRPDPRPDVRENLTGDLSADFDFTQQPRAPLLLPVHPTTTLQAVRPFTPEFPSATPGNAQAILTWKVPQTDGGSPITGYKVTPYRNGVAQAARVYSSPANSETVTSLSNASSYTFTVAAINALGTGPPSIASAPITVGAPAAPSSASATEGNAQAVVTWTTPSTDNGSAITGYVVTPYVGASAMPSTTFMSTATSQIIGGLSNGTAYSFRVAAINGRGTGPQTETTAITIGAPTPPSTPSATPRSGAATVQWSPPTDNGSAVTGYTVTTLSNGLVTKTNTFGSLSTTQTISGLISGKSYSFTVAATNARGTSPPSVQSNSVTPT